MGVPPLPYSMSYVSSTAFTQGCFRARSAVAQVYLGLLSRLTRLPEIINF